MNKKSKVKKVFFNIKKKKNKFGLPKVDDVFFYLPKTIIMN